MKINKISRVFFFLFVLSFGYSFGQTQIAVFEYWFNDDFANRSQYAVTGNETVTINTQLETPISVGAGLHKLSFRSKDNQGNYTPAHHQMIYKNIPYTGGLNIVGYEYWIDTSFSERISVPVTSANPYVLLDNLNLEALAPGLYSLNVRAKDNRGMYSTAHTQLFYKNRLYQGDLSIVSYEYWIDKSFSERIIVPVTSSNPYILLETLNMDTYSSGLYVFNIRAKDSKGMYSTAHSQLFYKTPEGIVDNKIISYHYWFDNDFENRTAIALPEPVSPHNLQLRLEMPATFNIGEKHVFHVQYQDQAGQWSVASVDTFKVVPLFTEEEFDMLKVFYRSTNGDNWHNTQNGISVWDTTDMLSVNDWYGLSFSDGNVSSINMTANNLTGILPADVIAEFPNLQTLKVDSNSVALTAALPSNLSLNIKAQSFDCGTIAVNKTSALDIPIYDLSRYSHSGGTFTTNNRFDLNVNEAYKTRITSSEGLVTATNTYVKNLNDNDTISLVQYNGDAIGTIYRFLVVNETPVSVSSISLNKTETTLLIGENETLTYTITPFDATNQNVIWSSDNTDIVSVDNGIVTAISQGTAIITVTTEDGNKTSSCTVTVESQVITPVDSFYVELTVNNVTYGTVEGAGTYAENTIATVRAVSNQGYKFVDWTNNGSVVSTDVAYSFMVTENTALVANFTAIVDEEITVTPDTTTVTVAWKAVMDAESYTLTIYSNEDLTQIVCVLQFDADGKLLSISFAKGAKAEAFSFTVSSLKEGTTYYYTMISQNEEEEVISEKTGSFTTEGTSVGIPIVNTVSNIYPNPTTGKLTIDNGQLIIGKVEIFDINGKKLSTTNSPLSIIEVDLSGFANGVYLISVNNNVFKILKQ
ncbi:Ig-like domain-containing protein [Bacteroidales bacterium OttesenSCG-928-C19]|nr:Ig-like domain-containing protein [Bacteroidales bacterium OttesenSCG-928-C19]